MARSGVVARGRGGREVLRSTVDVHAVIGEGEVVGIRLGTLRLGVGQPTLGVQHAVHTTLQRVGRIEHQRELGHPRPGELNVHQSVRRAHVVAVAIDGVGDIAGPIGFEVELGPIGRRAVDGRAQEGLDVHHIAVGILGAGTRIGHNAQVDHILPGSRERIGTVVGIHGEGELGHLEPTVLVAGIDVARPVQLKVLDEAAGHVHVLQAHAPSVGAPVVVAGYIGGQLHMADMGGTARGVLGALVLGILEARLHSADVRRDVISGVIVQLASVLIGACGGVDPFLGAENCFRVDGHGEGRNVGAILVVVVVGIARGRSSVQGLLGIHLIPRVAAARRCPHGVDGVLLHLGPDGLLRGLPRIGTAVHQHVQIRTAPAVVLGDLVAV